MQGMPSACCIKLSTAPCASQVAASTCCSLTSLTLAAGVQKMNVKLDPEDFNGSKSPPGHQSQQAVYDIAQKYSQLWNNGAPCSRLPLLPSNCSRALIVVEGDWRLPRVEQTCTAHAGHAPGLCLLVRGTQPITFKVWSSLLATESVCCFAAMVRARC